MTSLQKQSPRLSEDQKLEVLDQAYNDAMERINTQKAGFRRLAEKVLSWISCARRPLTTSELQHALAVEVGDTELDKENFQRPERLVSVCAGLGTIDNESGVIRLVHYTTQEYFQRTQKRWFPHAECDIAAACLAYLSFDVFGSGSCRTKDELMTRLRTYRLYVYAAQNWDFHARNTLAPCDGVMKFLYNKAKVEASSQVLSLAIESSLSLDVLWVDTHVMGELQVAAYFGLLHAANELLEQGANVNSAGFDGWTPLCWAAWIGREDIAELLIEKGAEVNSSDLFQETPLSKAVSNGHEAVTKLLLKKGAEVNSRDMFQETPLSNAAETGHEAIARLLLSKGAKVDSRDDLARHRLARPCRTHMRLLPSYYLRRAPMSTRGMTMAGRRLAAPPSSAAWNGHETMVKLLFEKGAQVESREDGDTPLSYATMNGHRAIVELLQAKLHI